MRQHKVSNKIRCSFGVLYLISTKDVVVGQGTIHYLPAFVGMYVSETSFVKTEANFISATEDLKGRWPEFQRNSGYQ